MLHKCNPQEKSKSSALRLGRTPRRLLKMVISISAGDGLEVVVSISGGYSRVLPEVTPILSFAMVLTFDEVRLPDVVLLDADTNSGGHRNNLTMGRADVGRPGH